MRLLVVVLLVVLFIGAVSLPAAYAQQVPNVQGLKAFSPETNFMSLAGYLRWLVFQQTGQWISRQEADRMVQQQGG